MNMVSSQNLYFSSESNKDGWLTFGDAVWASKPDSYNRSGSFYDYLWHQPTLSKGEAPVVRMERNGLTEASIGFLKKTWRGHTVYSALSFYTLPTISDTSEYGMRLMYHWMKHSDIMIAAHPRPDLATLFERSGWLKFDTSVMVRPVSLAGLRLLYGKRLSVWHFLQTAQQYMEKPTQYGVHL